jgi:hypothetical protein
MLYCTVRSARNVLRWRHMRSFESLSGIEPSFITTSNGITAPYPRGCRNPVKASAIYSVGVEAVEAFLPEQGDPAAALLNVAQMHYVRMRSRLKESLFGSWVAMNSTGLHT